MYTHTNTHTKTLLFLIEKLSPTPVASPVSTCGEGAEKPHLMNLVGGSKDAIGRCQSREGEELIWKLDLRIIIFSHINSDITELKVRMKVHSLSSQSALCTLSPAHLGPLSHFKLPQKLLDNFVPLHRVLKGLGRLCPSSNLSPPSIYSGSLLTHCVGPRWNVSSSRKPLLIAQVTVGSVPHSLLPGWAR